MNAAFIAYLLLVSIMTVPLPMPGRGFKRRLQDRLWDLIAYLVSDPAVVELLIERAMRTPYTHLPGYMNRYWLFNAYRKVNGNEVTPIPWLPSIRIHHILRKDADRDLHDHPWDARTIILKGYYIEHRLNGVFARYVGDTARVLFGEYHTITEVSPEGVWTLFITFGYKGTWGFLVDGAKVPWREYMAQHPDKPWASEEHQS